MHSDVVVLVFIEGNKCYVGCYKMQDEMSKRQDKKERYMCKHCALIKSESDCHCVVGCSEKG